VSFQQQALLVPVTVHRRHPFRNRGPLRHQSIVRAEQKNNGKDGKQDKRAEKLVKGAMGLLNSTHAFVNPPPCSV
jgi:hypothetical protein